MRQRPVVKQLVDPPSLGDLVYENVAKAILRGQIVPGTLFSARQIAAQSRVSLMPVRDALKRLAAEGLVTFSPRRGVYVPQMTSNELREIFAVRTCLEGYAARFACSRLRQSDLKELQRLHKQMLSLNSGDQHVEWLRLDEEFHFRVFRAAGNDSLLRLLTEYWNRSRQRRPMASRAVRVRVRRNCEHAKILQALVKKDAAWTERSWRKHLEEACNDALGPLQGESGSAEVSTSLTLAPASTTPRGRRIPYAWQFALGS
jgi:DNA-binding GntR family transcriptional regulator